MNPNYVLECSIPYCICALVSRDALLLAVHVTSARSCNELIVALSNGKSIGRHSAKRKASFLNWHELLVRHNFDVMHIEKNAG